MTLYELDVSSTGSVAGLFGTGAVPLANRAWMNQLALTSDGVDTSRTSRTKHEVLVSGNEIRVAWINATNGETENDDPITIAGALEYGSLLYPLRFDGNARITLSPGGVAVSDPVGIAVVAGQTLYCRSYATVSSGEVWPEARIARTDRGEGFTTGSDLTVAGSTTVTAAAGRVFCPFAIIGSTPTSVPTVCILGDSIISGHADGNSDNAYDEHGWAVRALVADSLGFLKLSTGGQQAQTWFTNTMQRRRALIRGCTSAFVAFGTNDLVSGGRTAAQVTANLQAIVTDLRNLDVERVFVATVTPYTTSTDDWATTGNQTPHASEAARVTLNTTIRAATWHDGVIEAADAVETSRNSGIWKVGYNADAQHVSETGHAAIAAIVPTDDVV